ncbi:gamma-glutamyltransferase family protein [Pendulispora albinea]|uniref:Gamma-glutamyltransferase n=1 Tax=Pendulispora albinea TaxID=2741071 RepID=A0ABZ2M4L0_9BACT
MTNIETWEVRKPPIASKNGIVVTQHHRASQIGAEVLAEGGNAVDAAIAASFAIGVLEPWQSGLGAIGHMVVAFANDTPYSIDFSARTPLQLNPADYPLTGAPGPSIFSWPGVQGDRNMEGPYSFGVPGQVAGTWLAHRKFGRMPWARLVAPAAQCAEEGLVVDWYWTFRIASALRGLARYEHTASVYLPDGLVPSVDWRGGAVRLRPTRLARTLRHIAEAGGDDFYRGDLAAAIAEDARSLGSSLTQADLRRYEPSLRAIDGVRYRDSTIFAASGLTAGPSLVQALGRFAALTGRPGDLRSNAHVFPAIAESLLRTYEERLANVESMSADPAKATCTTQVSVIDREGNAVSLTQTLLQAFGSRVTLPETGILMNNALMWFDPVPGKLNSIGPGRTPLSNVCPVVARTGDGGTIALGASGGRRIFPAVMQLLVFLIDRGMTLDEAVHHPRIDVSGDPWVVADRYLPADALEALGRKYEVRTEQNAVFPNYFACANAVVRDGRSGVNHGAAYVVSPCAGAASG